MHENYLSQLRMIANEVASPNEPDIGDDAVIYHGEATCDMWQCHVPSIVCSLWPLLSEESRLAVYVTAKSFTMYDLRTRYSAPRRELDEQWVERALYVFNGWYYDKHGANIDFVDRDTLKDQIRTKGPTDA